MANRPALTEFLEAEFGGGFTIQTNLVTVGTTPTKLVDHNFERMGLVLVNEGSGAVNFTPGPNAQTTSGIVLTSNGSIASFTARDDLALVGWEFSAIVATGTGAMFVLEIIRYRGNLSAPT